MKRGGRREAKIEEIEDGEDDEKQKLSKSAAGVSDDDDDDGNEDLSLKIVEKSLMRTATLDRNNTNGVVLVDPGLGSGSDSGVGDLTPLSSSLVTQAVDACPSGSKKTRRKKKKAQIADQSVTIANEEKRAETTEEVQTIEEVPAVELVEADDANSGDVSVNVVLQKLLRGPRYFDPPATGGWPTCYNCGEEGHMAANCPSFTKKKKPCFVCGSLDHGARQCRKDQDCFICKQVGHRAKDCPEKHKVVSKICLRCGNSGHHMFSCSTDYSHDDLKEIQCYICKSLGHLCCANYVDDSSIEVSCYRCGELGHTGLSCSRLHEESTSNASPSFCYKCGEGGHFARECSNSTRLYDEGTITASLSSCYKCGEGGHFARECRSSAKARKRNHESSTPALRAHTEIKDNNIGVKSAPHDLGKKKKRGKTKSEQKSTSTPPKAKHRGRRIIEDSDDLRSTSTLPKVKRRGRRIIEDSDDLQRPGTGTPLKYRHRGGWITEDPGDSYTPNAKQNSWRSPSKPSYNRASGPHMSNPQSFKQMRGSQSGTSGLHGSAAACQQGFHASRLGSSPAFQQGYPASRLGSSPAFQQGYPDPYHHSYHGSYDHGHHDSYHHGHPSSTPPAFQNGFSGYQHGYSESRFGKFGDSGRVGNQGCYHGSHGTSGQYGWR